MNSITEKREPALTGKPMKDMESCLRAAAAKLRYGEDTAGIESLLNAMEELENAVETVQNSQRPEIDVGRFLPAVRKLYFYIGNRDIAGIADLLEDEFCPLAEKYGKGCDGT